MSVMLEGTVQYFTFFRTTRITLALLVEICLCYCFSIISSENQVFYELFDYV